MLKASVLADHGQISRARQLIDTLVAKNLAVRSRSKWQSTAASIAIRAWFKRELRHWNHACEGRPFDQESLQQDVERILLLMTRIGKALNIDESSLDVLARLMKYDLCTWSAKYRLTARVNEADRVVSFMQALGRGLVREFPSASFPYVFLGDAYLQQSKNAWKQNDVRTVKQGLTESIETLKQGLAFSGDTTEIQRHLRDYSQRLAKLPKE